MTQVKSWTWRDEHGSTPGAMLRRGQTQMFIPLTELFRVADALVDVAEQHETAAAATAEASQEGTTP